VILRLWRGVVRIGAEAALLDRLRAIAPRMQAAETPLEFTYGFRHEAGATIFLAASTWPDYASVVSATEGEVAGAVTGPALADLIESETAETFERLPPVSGRLDMAEGRVLGVVTGTVKPQHESIVQSMIDRSSQAALGAGALAAHLGRRLDDRITSVAIVVVWPKRDTMTRFVRSRAIPAIDPAFAAHLSGWRFETYDELVPDRLLVPTEGPAVLVVDAEGRYVDTTPGVESVLGIPGELLHGRSLLDLGADEAAKADLRQRFLETGVSHGTIDLLRPDGNLVRVRYRSIADVPAKGLRSSVLSRPSDHDDPRPTAVVVAEALGLAADPPIFRVAPAQSTS
jgi:PAS domain-containing protein